MDARIYESSSLLRIPNWRQGSDSSREKQLFHYMVKDKPISVLEKVSAMNRNVVAFEKLCSARGTTAPWCECNSKAHMSALLSDLIIAALHGTVAPRDNSIPCPHPAADFDSSWVNLIGEQLKADGLLSLEEQQKIIREEYSNSPLNNRRSILAARRNKIDSLVLTMQRSDAKGIVNKDQELENAAVCNSEHRDELTNRDFNSEQNAQDTPAKDPNLPPPIPGTSLREESSLTENIHGASTKNDSSSVSNKTDTSKKEASLTQNPSVTSHQGSKLPSVQEQFELKRRPQTSNKGFISRLRAKIFGARSQTESKPPKLNQS